MPFASNYYFIEIQYWHTLYRQIYY